MLGRIRREIQLIHYYSASRKRTAWTTAVEWSMLVSMVLAVPGMLLGERLVSRTEPVQQVRGVIAGERGGPFEVSIDEGDVAGFWTLGKPYGDFDLTVAELHCGWPFTSIVRRQRATLDVNVFAKAGVDLDVQLSGEAPLRAAIEGALASEGRGEMREAWRAEGEVQGRRHWRGTIGGALVWWMMLSFASVATVQVMRVAWLLVHVQRESVRVERRAQGRCAYCGYDMRGLEFHARCPECGRLVE